MPAGGEADRAARVDQHVDDRGEEALGALGRLGHLGVQRRQHGGRVGVHRHQGAPAEAQARGLGGRRGAVAGHVADHHRQAAVGQHEGVVEVAAHQQGALGRLVAGGQPQAAHARQALGQQAVLHRLPELALGPLGGLAPGRRRDRVALALHLALHEVEALHQLGQLAHGVAARGDRVGQPPARDAPDALADSSATGPPTRRQSWRLTTATTIRVSSAAAHDGGEGQQAAAVVGRPGRRRARPRSPRSGGRARRGRR